jgi:hypothetical protein
VDKLIEKEALSLLRTNSVIYVLSGVLPKKSPENLVKLLFFPFTY